MPDIVENIIFVYSGLSSDPKPTLKTTGNLKNGSRFREVDTGITYYFNKETDQWYPFEYQSITIKGSKSVADIGASEILQNHNIRHIQVKPGTNVRKTVKVALLKTEKRDS